MSYLNHYETVAKTPQSQSGFEADKILEVSYRHRHLSTDAAQSILTALKSATAVDLSNNILIDFPVIYSESLAALNLSFNRISVPIVQSPVAKLIELSLCDNSIRSVIGLRALITVEYLDLSKNELTVIEGLEGMSNLHTLQLSDNLLDRFISIRSLSCNKNLRDLDLTNNPICETTDFKYKLLNVSPKLRILNKEKVRHRVSLQSKVINDELTYVELCADRSSSHEEKQQFKENNNPLRLTTPSYQQSSTLKTEISSNFINPVLQQTTNSAFPGYGSYLDSNPSPAPNQIIPTFTHETDGSAQHGTIMQFVDPHTGVVKTFNTADLPSEKAEQEAELNQRLSFLPWRKPPNPIPRPLRFNHSPNSRNESIVNVGGEQKRPPGFTPLPTGTMIDGKLKNFNPPPTKEGNNTISSTRTVPSSSGAMLNNTNSGLSTLQLSENPFVSTGVQQGTSVQQQLHNTLQSQNQNIQHNPYQNPQQNPVGFATALPPPRWMSPAVATRIRNLDLSQNSSLNESLISAIHFAQSKLEESTSSKLIRRNIGLGPKPGVSFIPGPSTSPPSRSRTSISPPSRHRSVTDPTLASNRRVMSPMAEEGEGYTRQFDLELMRRREEEEIESRRKRIKERSVSPTTHRLDRYGNAVEVPREALVVQTRTSLSRRAMMSERRQEIEEQERLQKELIEKHTYTKVAPPEAYLGGTSEQRKRGSELRVLLGTSGGSFRRSDSLSERLIAESDRLREIELDRKGTEKGGGKDYYQSKNSSFEESRVNSTDESPYKRLLMLKEKLHRTYGTPTEILERLNPSALMDDGNDGIPPSSGKNSFIGDHGMYDTLRKESKLEELNRQRKEVLELMTSKQKETEEKLRLSMEKKEKERLLTSSSMSKLGSLGNFDYSSELANKAESTPSISSFPVSSQMDINRPIIDSDMKENSGFNRIYEENTGFNNKNEGRSKSPNSIIDEKRKVEAAINALKARQMSSAMKLSQITR